MFLSPIWRGRRKAAPARSRIAQFRAVIRAAQSIEGYQDRLRSAGLDSPKLVNEAKDVEKALSGLEPISLSQYQKLFAFRKPAWRQVPYNHETRSILMVPFAQARAGLDSCSDVQADVRDLYSLEAVMAATEDLRNLSQALSSRANSDWASDSALVAFCGIDAGLVGHEQREELWEKYQIPLFEQLVGTDGRVVASECEVHAGLHVKQDAAVIETIDGQMVITSLTDESSPALRVESGLYGELDSEACECGRMEARILNLRSASRPNAALVAA